MAKRIDSIEIFPGERKAGQKEGAMADGVYMEGPKPAEHSFGKSEDGKVLQHVRGALNLPLKAGKNKANAGYYSRFCHRRRIIPQLGTTTERISSDDWRHVFTDRFTRCTPHPILPCYSLRAGRDLS
jgi:hypothetical protein